MVKSPFGYTNKIWIPGNGCPENFERKKQAADVRKTSPESPSFRKTPAFSLSWIGGLSAPGGRPGLPTRTEYGEYNTFSRKSIQ